MCPAFNKMLNVEILGWMSLFPSSLCHIAQRTVLLNEPSQCEPNPFYIELPMARKVRFAAMRARLVISGRARNGRRDHFMLIAGWPRSKRRSTREKAQCRHTQSGGEVLWTRVVTDRKIDATQIQRLLDALP